MLKFFIKLILRIAVRSIRNFVATLFTDGFVDFETTSANLWYSISEAIAAELSNKETRRGLCQLSRRLYCKLLNLIKGIRKINK